MSRLDALLLGVPTLKLPPPSPEIKFHLFPELPLELRNKIWKMAAHEPRTIILDDRQRSPSTRYSWSSTVPNQRQHPGILHTSQEARAEGMRHYELCWEKIKFPSNAQRGRGIHWWANAVFVNFHMDVFRLKSPRRAIFPSIIPGSVDVYNFDPNVLRRIQHFALVYSTEAYYGSWTPSGKAPSIRSFTAIFPEGFTPEDNVDGDLDRQAIRKNIIRTLGGEKFQLFFKWKMEEGDDLVPCAAFGAMYHEREIRENQWWMV